MTIIPDLINSVYEGLIATFSEKQIKSFNGRLERGLNLALYGHVSVTDNDGVFIVASGSKKDQQYTVDLNNKTCNCPDSQAGFSCKHRVAAWLIQQVIFQAPAPQPETQPAAEEADRDTEAAIAFSGRLVNERIVWGVYTDDEKSFPVELLESFGETILVRALPEVVGEEIRPRFPFSSPFPGGDVSWSSSIVARELVSQVKVFCK